MGWAIKVYWHAPVLCKLLLSMINAGSIFSILLATLGISTQCCKCSTSHLSNYAARFSHDFFLMVVSYITIIAHAIPHRQPFYISKEVQGYFNIFVAYSDNS